jgi:hypothetical protein
MANYVDNLIAFRILYKLVTPFDKTEAYKRGVIDADGKVLVKIKDQTPEQKDAYDMLDRLVFSLKRLLGKVPGGKSQIASFAAAYYLVKEAYENKTTIKAARVDEVVRRINEGLVLIEEELTVQNFMAFYEEGEGGAAGASTATTIANRTGAAVSTDVPKILVGKNHKTAVAKRKKVIKNVVTKSAP